MTEMHLVARDDAVAEWLWGESSTHRAVKRLPFFELRQVYRASPDSSRDAGHGSRECIIRVLEVGKFGRRTGKVLFWTSVLCSNYDGASHFH